MTKVYKDAEHFKKVELKSQFSSGLRLILDHYYVKTARDMDFDIYIL